MSEKPKYTIAATATGGRKGHVKSEDGVIDLQVGPPPAFGGEPGMANPESLFASGWAACFDNAIIVIAGKRKLDVKSETKVEVTFGPDDEGAFNLSARIFAKIDGIERDKAEKLLQTAHQICPYSKATRDNIKVEVTLV